MRASATTDPGGVSSQLGQLFDLGETVTEMANCLMEEDGQQAKMPPKAGTTPKGKDIAQVKALPPSDDITMLLDSAFPSF